MSLTHRQNLALLATNYLKHLKFAKAASGHTSKSYAKDLSQFLRGIGIKTILYGEDDSFLVFDEEDSLVLPAPAPRPVPPELLLKLTSEAQDSWRSLAISSRNRKLACIKGFMKWLHQEGWLRQDLGARIHSPKVPVRIPHFLAVDEVVALLHSLRSDPKREADLLLVLLLYGGGLMVSEACGLKWSAVDFTARSIRVLGKGGRERIVALPTLCWPTLTKMKSPEVFVFGERPLLQRKAYNMVREAGARAGLVKPLHPHALRHSYATHMLSSGADLRVLQELMGHASLSATQKYTHLSVDHLARALETHHPLGKSSRK